MSGRIPQSFINDLLERVDIVDVIDARITLRKAGKNYQALCPFHDEKTASFSVSPDKQFYHCFGCHASGTALTFLMEHDRLEFVEAVETLARMAGLEVPREAGARPREDHRKLYEVLAAAEPVFRRSLKTTIEAIDYLQERGLSGVVARDFAIGYAPDEWQTLSKALGDEVRNQDLMDAGLLTRNDNGRTYDRFRGRIMFPIRDTRGRVIGFGGRIIGGASGPKYLNSPETPVFHKGRELYGLYEARKALRQLDVLVVVEGYMDVVALAQAGIANCVASLGTATTTDHFHKLYRYVDEVVCCFDGDSAGRQAAWRALENALPILSEGRQLKFVFLPDGEDPDTMVRQEGKGAFLRRLDAASPAIEYLFNRLGEGLDLAQLDGRAKLASLALPLIEQVPHGILRQLMQQKLATLTGFAAGEGVPGGSVPAGRPAAKPGSATLSRLQRRLLRWLLRTPALATEVDTADQAMLEELSEHDVFSEIVKYVVDNPAVDHSDIVGRWTGHEIQPQLLELLEQPDGLNHDATVAEFADGIRRYLELARRDQRRRLLAGLQANPSTEKLGEWWSLRSRDGGVGNPDPATGSTGKRNSEA